MKTQSYKMGKTLKINHLENLKKEIQNKFILHPRVKQQWRSEEINWSLPQRELLSACIREELKQGISARTLFNYLKKYDENTELPKSAVLNILAKYVGYKSWLDFQQKQEVKTILVNKKPTPFYKKQYVYRSLILISIIGAITFSFQYLFVNSTEIDDRQRLFIENTASSNAFPKKINIHYDVSDLGEGIFELDFGKPVRGRANRVIIDDTTGYFPRTISMPDFTSISLVKNDEIIQTTPLFIPSEGWFAFAGRTVQVDQPYISLPVTAPNLFNESCMLLPPETVREDVRDFYWTHHKYVNNFGWNGDSLNLEVRFKNPERAKSFYCFDSYFILIGENFEAIKVNFIDESCKNGNATKFAFLEFANTRISGENLPFLLDLSQWHTLKISTKNNSGKIFIDGELLYQTGYEGAIGRIKMINCAFKGSGVVDWIRVSNLNGNILYFEDFN